MGSGQSVSKKSQDISEIYSIDKEHILEKSVSYIVYKATLLQQSRFGIDSLTQIPSVVSIKVVDKTSPLQDEVQEAYTEIEFLSKFRLHFATTLFEYFDTPESLYIVNEYLQGPTLEERVKRYGTFSEKEVSSIVLQLASLVSTLSSRKYAHREIQPSNIVLADGVSTNIRLINFGSVACLNKSRTLQKKLSFKCSGRCLAPETMSSYCDTKCDVWAIGVLIYYLLSGTYPFRNDHLLKNGEQISISVRGQVTFHHPIWAIISEAAKTLILKLLISDPEKRMSAEDILRYEWVSNNPGYCTLMDISSVSFEQQTKIL